MKFKKIFTSIFLSVCLSFVSLASCAPVNNDTKEPTDTTDVPENVYSSLISLLESEIKQLRDEQRKSEAEYEEKLKALESLLAAKEEGTKPEDTEDLAPSPFTYTVSDGKATITAYSGNYSVLVIPSELDSYPVVSISDSVFSGNTKLVSVSLPSSLEKLGWFAFSGCTSLKSITIPSSVNEIGYDAFAHCTKLTFYCAASSYAEKYAESYGISCVSN